MVVDRQAVEEFLFETEDCALPGTMMLTTTLTEADDGGTGVLEPGGESQRRSVAGGQERRGLIGLLGLLGAALLLQRATRLLRGGFPGRLVRHSVDSVQIIDLGRMPMPAPVNSRPEVYVKKRR
jgi:hypothetical protein